MGRSLGFALAALLALCISVRAQETASSGITGQVLDSSKAGLSGASITVTNTATNAQRVTQADSEGRFTVPNLPPGNYSLRIELSGFQTAEVKDLTLRNGEMARPTFTLGLATLSETISVQAESPLLQKTNASVSQTISQKQIENLPVAGRNPLAFATLSAGVTPQAFNRGTQFGAAGSSRSLYVTVGGGRQRPEPVCDSRGRPRQLDQLRHRRRVRAVAALQQSVAEPAARRRPG